MTFQQVFAFFAGLFHLGQSLSNGALGPALSTGVIPIVQITRKWWQERSLQAGKAKLREQIVKLDEFLNAVSHIESISQTRLRSEPERERAEAIAKLMAIVSSEGISYEPAGIRRAFLMYAPKGIVSLSLHILFYVSLAATVLVAATLAPGVAQNRSLLSDFLLAVGVWAIVAWMFRKVALVVDQIGPANQLDRLLLFYPPVRPSGWIVRTLFYIALTLSLIIALIVGITFSSALRESELLLGLCAVLAIPLPIRFLAAMIERTRPPNRVERWLLLFPPPRRSGWILRALFYLTLPMSLQSALTLMADWQNVDVDSVLGMVTLAMISALLRSAVSPLECNMPPNRIQRWFLLYRPISRAGWLAHGLFYFGVVLAITIPITLTDISPNDSSDRFGTALMLLMAAGTLILSRVSAMDFDPAHSRSPRRGRFRTFLLFYVPSRRWLWVLHVPFYWVLNALIVLPIFVLLDDPEERLAYIGAFAVLALIALGIREFAARLEAAGEQQQRLVSDRGICKNTSPPKLSY